MTNTGTLVIQSHRVPLPCEWIEHCLSSVRHWCEKNQFQYRFLDNELFDFIDEDLYKKLKGQPVISADLARLKILQDALGKGYQTVVWLDADFLIFDPENFQLPDDPYAVGREVWVQYDKQKDLKVYKKVHNAFLMFRQENSFLPFYTESAERLLRKNQAGMPPQFIGPKLLTALHNIAQLPVMELAGMLSPLVIRNIVTGEGQALRLFVKHSSVAIAGANLCISSCASEQVSAEEMERLITILSDRNFETLYK